MTSAHPSARPGARPPLVRPRASTLGGVCSGLSVHLGWPVRRVRWVFAGLTALGGFGVLLYLWLWALVPLEGTGEGAGESDAPGSVARRAPVAGILAAVGAVATLVASAALVRMSDTAASQGLLAVMLASTGAVAWSLTYDRGDSGRSDRYARGIRITAVTSLVISGAVALATRPVALNAFLGVLLVVLGVAVLVAPRVLLLWTDLMGERAERVRQEQRAEIAAHLHDSVLQTLALIQNRSGASSEVARIARAQERELREWLFRGDTVPSSDLATELREVASAIELDFAVRIDVVAAGAAAGGAGPQQTTALVSASREAMLNAARHAGGDVSVYVETPPGAIDVFIRDRGPGVDLSTLPVDRLGIRESIIGRMTRAGGTASVGVGAGGSGTEVHLHLEVDHD